MSGELRAAWHEVRGSFDWRLDADEEPADDVERLRLTEEVMDETKTCISCGRDLPEESFPPDERYADLLNPTCRECRRAMDLERSVRPDVKAARRKREAERRKRDPQWREAERVRARRNRRRSAA